MSMVIDIDRSKWEIPSNRLPQRHHTAEKQTTIRTQVDALLKLRVIEESRATYLRLREAKCRDGRVRGLADSEYTDTANSFSAGYNEANSVWSIGLHCGLSPDTAGPSLETPRSFHGHGGIVPMDSSGHGIERIWPLLSTQYVKHSPSGARVSNLRTVH